MLPDIRLLVVAVLAAIAGISCGLGLFATFRVNHEPLLRLSEGGPPLQLALDNRTAPEIGFPIAARLPVNAEVKPISAPVLIPTPPSADNSQASTGLGSGVGPSDSAPVATPDNSEVASPGAAEGGSIPTTPTTSAIQSSEAQPVAESATTSEQQAGAMASKMVVAVANEAAVDKAGDERSVGEDQPPAAKPSETPDAMPAKTEAAETLAVMPAENPATETPAVTPAKTPATKAPAKIQATVARAPVRRAAQAVRIRRAPTTAAAQATGQYAQATYQYAQTLAAYQWIDPNVQASQTARRVVVKRHHAVKKTAPPAQSSFTGATALGPQ
jgi:hypothetical protein